MTTESRLGVLEGRTEEQAATMAGLREDLRQGLAEVRVGLDAANARIDTVNARIDALDARINARIDRLIFAMLGVGVTIALAQVGVIVTLVLRT